MTPSPLHSPPSVILSASEETGRPTTSFNSSQRYPISMLTARIPHVQIAEAASSYSNNF